MQPISAIIFDKDGTLFDFTESWAAWAERLIDELSGNDAGRRRALAQAIGFDSEQRCFEPGSLVIAATPTEIAEPMLAHLPGSNVQGLVARMNLLSAQTPLVEAAPLRRVLPALKARGLRIGLATNDAEVPARAHLESAGVLGLFDFVAGFDSGHGAKPGPGQLLAFAKRFGLDPARVAMVGDSSHDLAAGRAAGMRTVAVLTGVAQASELAPLADAVLPDIGHLGGWIDGMAAVPAA